MFTGDRSGDFLYAALYRAGLASQPRLRGRGRRPRADRGTDHGGGALRTAGEPPDDHRARQLPAVERAEARLLGDVRVVICLGAFAWDAALRLRRALRPEASAPRPRPRFGHGAEAPGDPWTLLGSYHPSQQNTFTGRLTEAMLDEVLSRGRELAGERGPRG